jgi:hypothetical protein
MNCRLWAVFLLGAALMLSGCQQFAVPGLLDKTLFPATTPSVTRAPNPIMILMSPADAALETTGSGKAGAFTWHTTVSIGSIVEAAALISFATEFAGGVTVQRAQVAAPAPLTVPPTLSVSLANIHYEYRDDVLYAILIPLPVVGGVVEKRDMTSRLTADVRIIDEHGTVLWKRSYDSGHERWKPDYSFRGYSIDQKAKGVQRMAHQQAIQLLTQAARDVRDWFELEKRRERIL